MKRKLLKPSSQAFIPHPSALIPAFLLRFVRLIVVILSLLACLYGVWYSGREGVSQLLASYGAAAQRLDAADWAVRFGASVPEAHSVRAGLLFDAGARVEALEEYERAVALRPHDYALWVELGRARDQAGEAAGALAAYVEAVRLAPFYAEPRWLLGNTLYRSGRLTEAFAELQRAAASNPKLLPQAINLAWAAFDGDAQAIEQALQLQTPQQHLALARFLVRRGKTMEAITQFRAAGGAAGEERRSLVAELLAAKRFKEAYEVWSSGRPPTDESLAESNARVLNGGFEAPVTLSEPGFGWQLPQNIQAVQAAQDRAEPRAGAQSLRLSWNGSYDPANTVLSQLILVEPNARYQLRFAARTEKLVSGGLPVVLLADASSNDGRTLGTAVTLPQGNSAWQDYAIEFTTTATTAVQLIVRRQNCSTSPCPIFGRVWLDDFSVRGM
jgi:tetratricopeptide (TPR) repeat protein